MDQGYKSDRLKVGSRGRAWLFQVVAATATVCVVCSKGEGYTFDSDDFAVQVVEYVPGSNVGNDSISGQPLSDPQAALGRPTVDTTGDDPFGFGSGLSPTDPVTVVPVYSPFRAGEIVTIGEGGWLTVKFNRAVMDDPGNPFGLDLTVFGNAAMIGQGFWRNGDPGQYMVGGQVLVEPVTVAVSQDGQSWHEFTAGPFGDDFAPTLGRVLDPAGTSSSGFWGGPTDPTLPMDPSVVASDFNGKTLAQIVRDYYGDSAGGTSFDLGVLNLPIDPATGLKWVRYVKIINRVGSGVAAEIDAFSDVASVPVPEPASGLLVLAAAAVVVAVARL